MIGILGSTSYVAQGLIQYYKGTDIVLLSRSGKKAEGCKSDYIENFSKYDYDVIINCINAWKPGGTEFNELFTVSECYDTIITNYLRKHIDTLYVNFSSGDIYFLDVNNINHYSLCKLYLEAKHRSLPFLNIVDIRLFSYFSRFIPINRHYLMSDILRSLTSGVVLVTDDIDIVRDYIIPDDLCNLVNCCMNKRINDSFDAYSKFSVNKFDLLTHLSIRFGLEWTVGRGMHLPGTVFKEKYYSTDYKASKIGYVPQYSSLDGIEKELDALLPTN